MRFSSRTSQKAALQGASLFHRFFASRLFAIYRCAATSNSPTAIINPIYCDSAQIPILNVLDPKLIFRLPYSLEFFDTPERDRGYPLGDYCVLWDRLGRYKIATNRRPKN